jgi:hypothetical protein
VALNEIQRPFVGGEGKAIEPLDVRRCDNGFSSQRVDAIVVRRQLGLRVIALVVIGNAERRIRERDGTVAPADDVVGRISCLPPKWSINTLMERRTLFLSPGE